MYTSGKITTIIEGKTLRDHMWVKNFELPSVQAVAKNSVQAEADSEPYQKFMKVSGENS